MQSIPQHIQDEFYSRVKSFFGEAAFQKTIHNESSFVIVVGLGGVGSHAAHMLVRSGIQKIRLIDFDQVSLSSLNRHAVARLKDVGQPKSSVLRNHLMEIVPWCSIEAINEMFTYVSNFPSSTFT